MASGKQSKRRRREAQVQKPPLPRSTRGRQASPKVLIAAAALVVLIAGGAGLGIALSGGSSSPSPSSSVAARGTLVNALPGAADVQQLFKGLDQHGNTLGSTSAPVTMTEYIDLQCPFCKEFETRALPAILTRYVRTGKVAIQFRILAFIGPDSAAGRGAAIAAGQQNRMFNLIELLYDNQGTENTGWLDDNMIAAAAASIPGLAVPRLLTDRASNAVSDQASMFDTQAQTASVNSTPTILVGRPGATPRLVKLTSPTDAASVAAAIEAALP